MKFDFEKNQTKLAIILIIFLILLTFFTTFYGDTDVKDYANTSKFFAGDLNSKIRSSHSYLLGFVHSPFVNLTNSFISFKITSLIFLFLLIYSVYWISNKNKKTFWLMLISPIIWYMAPWISPIQISSLFFIWAYYFIKKFDKDEKISYLFYSGLLIGLGWAFWGTILFFGILLGISFLYNKKIFQGIYFLIFVLIGLLPRLILDQFIFGFPFYSVIRHIFAVISFSILGGFYNQGSDFSLLNIIILFIFLPIFFLFIFRKNLSFKNKKSNIFLVLATLLLISNPQIRFTLVIFPIFVLQIYKRLTKKQFLILITFLIIVSLLVINPYLIQLKYDLNHGEFNSFYKNPFNLEISSQHNKFLIQDLNSISQKYPNQTFVIGNTMDKYAELAYFYWGSDIKEFTSIQDYTLWLNNETTLQYQEFCTRSKIPNRRDFCFSAKLRKSFNDSTDYNSINYAISDEETLNLEGFEKLEEFQKLNVFEKV
jgi:hypothetical protein